MKKVLFVFLFGVVLFAQNNDDKNTLEQKRQEIQTTIQAIKGDISDAELARKNIYDQS